jgi:sterol O-acyltransferase
VESYVKKGRTKRIFRPTESILTYLCATDKNVEAFYHVFMVMICTAIFYSLMKDSVEAGKPFVDMGYYISGFGPLSQQLRAAAIWLPLKAAALLVYLFFLAWKALWPTVGRLASLLFAILFIAYNVAAHTVTVYTITHFDLPPVPALFLSVEQLRFTMKSYSFIRENAYKVVYPWHKEDKEGPAVWYAGQMEPQVGSFSAYVYFLFCPTLLYRDRYPR